MMSQEKIHTRKELAKILQHLKSKSKVVVTTNGCFDALHLGHLRYLQAARKLGDCLVVAMMSEDKLFMNPYSTQTLEFPSQ